MVISNRIGIIIINVLIVLVVPGNQHVPRVVPGLISPGILPRKGGLTLRESRSCPKRRRDRKKGKRKVQGVPQSQTAALPRPQEEEETDKSKQAQTEQTHEKHQDQPSLPQAR